MTPPHKKKIFQERPNYDDEDSPKRMRMTENFNLHGIRRKHEEQSYLFNQQSASSSGAHSFYHHNPVDMYFFNSKNHDSSWEFSSKRCRSFFRHYANPNDQESIGPEGIEKLCNDLNVNPDDILVLVLSWKMNAKEMGVYTLNEWLHGMNELKCDNITKLRSKLDVLRSFLNNPDDFRSIFRYSFDFAKESDQRIIDAETAKQMLRVLLYPRWELFDLFVEYLDHIKFKALNKDQYYNILDFSRTISRDLKNYDENGAWPVLLDEFVIWCRSTKGFEKDNDDDADGDNCYEFE